MVKMIRPVNIITTNVARELLRVAAQNATSISKLYIEINAVNTFIKNADSDFTEIPDEEFAKYTQESFLRDKRIEFEQRYDIEIKSHYQGYPFQNMICEIEFKENAAFAYLIIKKGSKLNYYDNLYNDFLNFIIEQKLRSNIMIYLFDVKYKQDIKQFVDVIKKIKTITFQEDKKILISKGFDEIQSVSAEICMTIEESNDIGAEDNEGKVDYSNRGFLLSCVEGEELFNFIKPKQGKHGRNCRGKIIEVEIVNVDAKPTFTVNDSIEVQDSYENIKYLSNGSGYLIKKGNNYDVSNSIEVDEISFKTTGTINSDLDSEISINVIKENPLEDAIEEGMTVKVQKLSIKGSIGRYTQVEARDISISGQSHNDSFIKCINANIGLHKGKIVGRKVEVKTLEGGEIVADEAIVGNAMRGKIRAKIITIEILGSHVTMEASQGIEIHRVRGEENKFIIDPLVDSGFDEDKEDDESFIKKIEGELKALLRMFKDITVKVKNNLEPCKKIKAAIIKNKNDKVEIPLAIIQKFKTCKIMQTKYKKIKEDVEYKKSQYEKLKKKLPNGDLSILNVKIQVNEPMKGYNNILYKLNNPTREIELNTNDSMNKKIFTLIEDDEGILKIVNVD